MFTVAVRFVSGRYYAASHLDRTGPEWPPILTGYSPL